MSCGVLLVKGYSADCGERCSGTNRLTYCLAYNLPWELIIYSH